MEARSIDNRKSYCKEGESESTIMLGMALLLTLPCSLIWALFFWVVSSIF